MRLQSAPLSVPTFSVVVCCYTEERWSELQRALDSLRHQEHPVDEIAIVVDHNDLLLERLRLQARAGNEIVVANDGPPGLSGARNTGVRVTSGDVIGFLDDDAEAAPDWSWHLLGPYRDPMVLGVGGRIVPRFENGRPRGFPPELDWVVGCTYQGHRRSRGPVRNLIGANMSLRRIVFDRVGGFDSEFGRTLQAPSGCEETELCRRATHVLDGEMFYEPEAVVQHDVPPVRTARAYVRARARAEGHSKARVARVAGRRRGLAAERSFLMQSVPRALLRDGFGGASGRVPGGWKRVTVLVDASFATALGYLRGRTAIATKGGRTAQMQTGAR
jgi:glycosyltransferase involved in cell wall biosynthesis